MTEDVSQLLDAYRDAVENRRDCQALDMSTGDTLAAEAAEAAARKALEDRIEALELAIVHRGHETRLSVTNRFICGWRRPDSRGIVDLTTDCTPENCIWTALASGTPERRG